MKQPSIKKLDNMWANLVKIRDGGCLYCGKKDYLNSHHIFSRSKKSTRWYLDNGVTLCTAHHVFSSGFSAHKTPAEFIFWIIDKKGEDWFNSLRLKANSIEKRLRSDILEELSTVRF
jgi:hypothetical protein